MHIKHTNLDNPRKDFNNNNIISNKCPLYILHYLQHECC